MTINSFVTYLLLSIFSIVSFAEPSCVTCLAKAATSYQNDTISSLELMRGENGLVKDAVWISRASKGELKVVPLNARTAPTNIALDLLINAELSLKPASKQAPLNLRKMINTLDRLPYHQESGLFFREYDTKGYEAPTKDVSAIDNLHLALALWTVAENFPETVEGKKAKELFDRMDFSCFLDPKSALLHGNLTHKEGKWTRDTYHFGDLGSEARSLYSLGYALGLFGENEPKNFPNRALSALKAETVIWKEGNVERKLLRTWDGGAFQLLLPNLLIGESHLSKELKTRFESYGDYVLAEGKRKGLPLPAAYSASATGINVANKMDPKLEYSGKQGQLELVNLENEDLKDKMLKANWESVVSPHAFILAATTNPKKFEVPLQDAANLESNGQKLYQEGVGWMDGYSSDRKVIPVQLALDQGMIQLAMFQMSSQDGKTLSARTLQHNSKVFRRLKKFYEEVDKKLAPAATEK